MMAVLEKPGSLIWVKNPEPEMCRSKLKHAINGDK